jgi:mono/diheme cytochrome c family protein/plastocyanin
MSDEPGREPEERLPAPRSPESDLLASPDRFASPPSARTFSLTPERAARIVRQSADARLVGFLAVVFVSLFVIVYYFYELAPGGFLTSRQTSEVESQQVTAVERGYNLFEANCARCHGVNGEGGIGPTLNRQDKLYQHLNPAYIQTMLTVGGRYACGDPNSLMPVWSNVNGGPLNYQQIADIIAFIRAPSTETFIVRDPSLFTPVIDPATGKDKTFTGWVDPNYKPAPNATPFPACWKDEYSQPSASPGSSSSPAASGSPSASPSASQAPSGTVLDLAAQNIAYDKTSLEAPANQAFQIKFTNNDAGIPHNVSIHKDSPTGQEVFKGTIFSGVATQTYDVPALPAGTYSFVCSVHPNMTGTLTIK